MQLVYITKGGSKCGGNLRISLITVSHMASCNLQNLFLEVWKLAQMCHLNWVTRVSRREFKQIVYLTKET